MLEIASKYSECNVDPTYFCSIQLFSVELSLTIIVGTFRIKFSMDRRTACQTLCEELKLIIRNSSIHREKFLSEWLAVEERREAGN